MNTITKLKSRIAAALHGTSTSKIKSFNAVIEDAAGRVLKEIDPIETKRTSQITNALYDEVFDYILPSDLKGKKVIDIYPQASRVIGDNFVQRHGKEFGMYRSNNTLAIKNNSGVKSIRISKSLIQGKLIHDMDTVTSNGTWAVGDDATNITQDGIFKITGGASINFDVDGSGTTAHIENSDMIKTDLEDHDEVSAIFVWLYMPVAVTDATLRWGNSNTVYWSATVTANHDTTAFQVGWNLLRFDWNGATETGTVDPTEIDYIRVAITYDGNADTDYRVDSIISKLPEIYEIEYYSKFLFRETGGTWVGVITDDSNIINLDTESYDLLFDRTMILLAPQIQGKDSSFDLKFYQEEYKNGAKMYTSQYPSEALKPQMIYYQMPFRKRR